MLTNTSDLPWKNIKIRQDERSSAEVYYGGSSVAIPFMWESQPGTPKVRFCKNPLPPLTPPPSYYHFNLANPPIKKHSKSSLLHTVLSKLTLTKTRSSTSSASYSSLPPWSSSYLIPSSPFTPTLHGKFGVSSPRSSFDSRIDEEYKYGSPVSSLCFGATRNTDAKSCGCSSRIMKVLLGEFA